MSNAPGNFFELAPQCCDASYYLVYGRACAVEGNCYDPWHPIASSYWFSIPYRYGWSVNSLVLAHILLLLASVALSIFAIRRLVHMQTGQRLTLSPMILTALASLLIHSVFLYPVLQHSLSDAPACLLTLMATWLLLITPDKNPGRTITLAGAAICLGLAALFRIFFAYVLAGVVVVWLLTWIFNARRQLSDLTLLLAVLIVCTQFYASWRSSQRIEYLPANPGLVELHANIPPVGIDTVLPGNQFASYSPCANNSPAKSNPAKSTGYSGDVYAIACLMVGRLYFYLGSYSTDTFWNPESGEVLAGYDFVLPLTSEMEAAKKINATNIQQEITNLSTDNRQRIMRIAKKDLKADAEIYQWLELSENSKYKISFQAWSTIGPQYITVDIRDHDGKEAIVMSEFILTDKPQLFTLDKYSPMRGLKNLVISFPYIAPNSELGQKAKAIGAEVRQEYFYISNVQVENIDLQQMRYRSPLLLLANSIAFAGALLLALKCRHQLNALQWMAYPVLLISSGIALALIAEQRYAISIMITGWVLFLAGISGWILQTTNRAVERKILVN